jgi:hypothetical protein
MKNLLVVAVLLMAVSAVSFGQSTTASATANVNATLTIGATGTLALGNVPQGGTVTVLSKGANVPLFTIAGAANAGTTVTVTPPANLVNTSLDNLQFNATAPSYNTLNNQAASTYWVPTSGAMPSVNTSGTGALFVWVGGGVTATSGQPTGQYNGVITVSFTQP